MMVEMAMVDDLVIHDCNDYLVPIALREANFGSGPEPRVSSEAKASGHGSINRTRYFEPRMIELVGYVHGASPIDTAAILDELRGSFHLRTSHKLRFRPYGAAEDFELDVVIASRFDAPAVGWMPLMRWAVTLEAPDPRMYAATWEEVSYEPSSEIVSGIGLGFPLDLPLVFSAEYGTGLESLLYAWNDGTVQTPVEFTVTGPASVQAIVNHTSGAQLAFSLMTLGGEDVLVADTGKRTLHLNGVPVPEKIDSSESTWFQLQPGENAIELIGSGFLAGTTNLRARYREARL